MVPPKVAPTLASLRDVLTRTLEGSRCAQVVVAVEVKAGGARRLLNLKETDETAYFVSGQGSKGSLPVPESSSTFVGLGAVASRRFEGAGRFREAQEYIRATFADLELSAELAPLVRFFGGASFSPGRDGSGNCWSEFGDARFLLPRCLYVDDETRPDESATLLCLASREEFEATLDLAESVLVALETVPVTAEDADAPPPSAIAREESEGASSWSRLVEGIKTEIVQGSAQKIVAARRVTLQLSEAPEVSEVLSRMNESAPLCARFCLRIGHKTFIGATPERLVQKSGSRFTTEALAGSISAGAPDAAETLLKSDKDRREHAYVVEAIRDSIAPLCSELQAPEVPEVRRLASIFHLRTPIEGRLSRETHILDLVECLHPTPAVGGMPRQKAIEFINTHENAERGWYAAPVGWVDAAGNGEFVVALRSGLIAHNRVHLYAGAGIVEGSDSSAEYAETELKLSGMLGALGLPSSDFGLPASGQPASAEPRASQVKQLRDGRVYP